MTVALVVVDVQNDFTESGPFSLTGNDAIARRIGAFVASHRHLYDLVITTQDWHIEPGEHFVKHPVHCVAGSAGAALDPELDIGAGATFTDLVDLQLYKGQYGDDYSGFAAAAPDGEGEALPVLLQRAGVDRIDVCGFAEDGCVAATVRDGLTGGYRVRLVNDLSGASSPENGARIESELAAAGAEITPSDLVG
jgi:nicotinamidase/pyrazinamidase